MLWCRSILTSLICQTQQWLWKTIWLLQLFPKQIWAQCNAEFHRGKRLTLQGGAEVTLRSVRPLTPACLTKGGKNTKPLCSIFPHLLMDTSETLSWKIHRLRIAAQSLVLQPHCSVACEALSCGVLLWVNTHFIWISFPFYLHVDTFLHILSCSSSVRALEISSSSKSKVHGTLLRRTSLNPMSLISPFRRNQTLLSFNKVLSFKCTS